VTPQVREALSTGLLGQDGEALKDAPDDALRQVWCMSLATAPTAAELVT
jgi:hypothetical protein